MINKLIDATVIIILIFLLFSCGGSFLLSDEDNKENDIDIISLVPGGIIEQGETLAFKVLSSNEEDQPDKLEIYLYTSFGDRIGKLENTSFAINEELSLNLFQSLVTGEYSLEFVLYLGNDILCEKEITFFYTEEEFHILGIESFPPSVFPGATVLLSTTIAIPDGYDPFLRWSVDGEVLTKGLISNGSDKILWSVPMEEGVYSVKVELFPTSPGNTDDFPFASEIFMDVELYVSESSTRPSRYLYPEDSYYTLYHFDGNLVDTATGRYSDDTVERRIEAIPIGEPQLITAEEDFGYYIDEFSGFRIDECILPVIDGQLKPFTISLGLELDPAQADKNILSIRTFDNLFNLTIYIGPGSYVYASIQSGSQEIIIPSFINAYAVEYRFVLSLSIQPPDPQAGTPLTALWYFDGIQTNVLSFEDIELQISSDGETIIGGEKGFAGVIDELGVYFINEKGEYTTDPDLYKKAIEHMYGDNSIFAQGFDGMQIPDSIEVNQETTAIKNGTLNLTSTLSTVFSITNIEEQDIKIIIDFAAPVPENGRITLYWQDEYTPFLDIMTSGEFMTPPPPEPVEEEVSDDKQPGPVVLKNINSSFYVKISAKGTKLSFPGEELQAIDIPPVGEEMKDIILKIENNDETPVVIESITVVRE